MVFSDLHVYLNGERYHIWCQSINPVLYIDYTKSFPL